MSICDSDDFPDSDESEAAAEQADEQAAAGSLGYQPSLLAAELVEMSKEEDADLEQIDHIDDVRTVGDFKRFVSTFSSVELGSDPDVTDDPVEAVGQPTQHRPGH